MNVWQRCRTRLKGGGAFFLPALAVLCNIPGRHSNTPPLRVSDVFVLHRNNDRWCREEASLNRRTRGTKYVRASRLGKVVTVAWEEASVSAARVRRLSVLMLSARPGCVWEVKQDTTTHLPCGMLEYYNELGRPTCTEVVFCFEDQCHNISYWMMM